MLSRRSLLLGLTAATAARSAGATLARALTLTELVYVSRHCALCTPLDAFSRWEKVGRVERIVTYSRLRIDQPLDGRVPATKEVVVRGLGGTVGDIGQIVPGEATLRRGQRAAVFLEELSPSVFAVTGMAQGHYPIIGDGQGVHRLRSLALGHGLVGRAGSAAERLDGRTVPEAEALVFEEISRGAP